MQNYNTPRSSHDGAPHAPWFNRWEQTSTVIPGEASYDGRRGARVTEIGYTGDLEVVALPMQMPTSRTHDTDLTTKTIAEMDQSEREMWGLPSRGEAVLFRDLSAEVQELVLAETIYEIERTSSSEDERYAADQRGRAAFEQGDFVHGGDLIHTSRSPHLKNILRHGLFAGELVDGVNAPKSDRYPYNLDATVITSGQVADVRGASAMSHGDVAIVIAGEHLSGKTTVPEDTSHALVFAGVPSTEIRSFVMLADENDHTPEAINERRRTLHDTMEAIIENGRYVPVVDAKGDVLFTPGAYDQARQNGLSPVELVPVVPRNNTMGRTRNPLDALPV